MNPLYEHPTYYDVLFKRDVQPEVAFLLALFRQQTGREPRSILELGCGPGYHARAFARSGYRVLGLDGSEPMIRFARQEGRREQSEPSWLVGDMRGFALAEPVDLALCLFDSIDGLCTIDDFVAHFRAVAANLSPDGRYVIGQSHQRDAGLFDYGPFHYEGVRNGCAVSLDWATDVRVDTLGQTADVEIVVEVSEQGRRETHRFRTRESFATPVFLTCVARLSGVLTPVAWYGDFSLDRPYDDSPASTCCLSVLQKTAAPAGPHDRADR